MKQQLLVAFILLASVDFSAFARHTLSNTNISRIIDGDDLWAGEYVQYQVSVQFYIRRKYVHVCGGAIISRSHVLTAGHCCDGYNVEDMSVLAVLRQLDESGGMRIAVKSCDIHEKYSNYDHKWIMNDIAIMRLERDLTHPDYAGLKAIGFSGVDNVGGNVSVILTGWGHTDKYGTTPNTYQILNHHTITNAECRKFYKLLLDTQICATGPKGSTCSGDSGSPLVMNAWNGELVVGILSREANCADYPHNVPDVYTRVLKFETWIREHMK